MGSLEFWTRATSNTPHGELEHPARVSLARTKHAWGSARARVHTGEVVRTGVGASDSGSRQSDAGELFARVLARVSRIRA